MSSSSTTINPVSLMLQIHVDKRLNNDVAIRGDFIVISGHYFDKDAVTTIKNDNEEVSSFHTLGGLFHLLKRVEKVNCMTEKKKEINPLMRRLGLMLEDKVTTMEEKFPLVLLPDELIVHILSYLSLTDIATKVSLVNNRMKMICLDSDLWTRLVLPEEARISPERAAAVLLLNRCKKLRLLDVTKRRDDGEMLALEVFGRSKDLKEKEQLKKLMVHKCSLTLLQVISKSFLTSLQVREVNKIFLDNMKCLNNLTELFLPGYRYSYLNHDPQWSDWRNELLALVGIHCKRLKVFHFGSTPTAKGVTALLSGGLSNTLRELSFEYPKDGGSLKAKHSPQLQVSTGSALSKCSLLEKLITSLSNSDSLTSHLDLEIICNSLQGLKTLQLYFCETLTAADYINAFSFRKLGNLVKLKLFGCWNLNDEALHVLADNCPKLTHLLLSDSMKMSNIGLRRVLSKCQQLKKLELWNIGKSEKVWRNGRYQAKTRNLTCDAFKGVDTPALRWLDYSTDTFTKKDVEEIRRDRLLLSVSN